MTSSLYGGHVNLGMIFLRLGWKFLLGVILFVLMRSTESWYNFLRSGCHFSLSVILFDLVLFNILVQTTVSWYAFTSFWLTSSPWCDFVWFGGILHLGAIDCILMWSLCFGWWYFFVHSFSILNVDFHFHICIYSVLHMDESSCCNVNKSWIGNIFLCLKQSFWYDFFTSWTFSALAFHS